VIAKRAAFTAEYWEKSVDKAIIRWYNGFEPLLPLLRILYIIIARCASFTIESFIGLDLYERKFEVGVIG